jgi:lysyl-tRNA synthetase class 2
MNDWRPTADVAMLRQRANLMRRIREFFDRRDVLEVNTPLLTSFGITDVNIDSLALANDGGFLRTSPEYGHKRLLAAGFGDLYELGPVFRSGESGPWHRIEFTLLEWYRVGWDWSTLADEVVALVRYCAEQAGDLSVRYVDWCQAFGALDDLDPLRCSNAQLSALCPEMQGECTRDMLLDYLFTTRIQPRFPPGTLTVVHGYPASQAALARLDPTDSDRAERFEVFHGTVELANGYRELTDGDAQRQRFERDNQRRKELGRAPMPIDERLLAAMHQGLPDCSGVALGVERLLMAIHARENIASVQTFADG